MFRIVVGLLCVCHLGFAWAAESRSWVTAARPSVSSPLEFHRNKKVGAGTVFSGATGLVGVHLHAYIGLDFGVGLGMGGSETMRTFNVYVRHLFADTYLAPYWTVGYARWWNEGGKPLTKSSPPFLYEKFLSGSERATGRFNEHILYPGLGLQWYKYNGSYEGLSVFAEALLMADIDSQRVHPTLGIGTLYYF